MTPSSLSTIDIGVIITLAFCIIIGGMRGFTSDFFGFFTWFGAVLIAKFVFPFVKPFISPYITTPLLVDGVSMILPFFASLMFLVALVQVISRFVRNSVLGGLDRSLGLLSGFIRGSFILSAIYIGILLCFQPGHKPEWITTSKFEPYLIWITKTLSHVVVPPHLIPPRLYYHLYDPQFQTPEKSAEEYVQSLSFPQPSPTPAKSQQSLNNKAQNPQKTGAKKNVPSHSSTSYLREQQHNLSQLFKSNAS